ncbi:glycosyltransferase family 25 protein [Rhodobaculum claviforme]|nr:glycosyltransferase family 25 protein [Rhodobaculum claviforme]
MIDGWNAAEKPLCLLISLPRSVERRARMEAQATTLPWPMVLQPGVDGTARWKELSRSVDLRSFRRNTGREVLSGEIGCYHAHLAAWARIAESGAEAGLILEDDVVLHPGFASAVAAAMSARSEWDVLKLAHIRARGPVCQGRLAGWRMNAYLGPATGMGAYLIGSGAIERLLPRMLPITRPIDHEIDRSHIHDLRHFGLEPWPAHPDDGGESTITGTDYDRVRKFSWYRRLPVHGLRVSNLLGKAAHLARYGRLLPRYGPVRTAVKVSSTTEAG